MTQNQDFIHPLSELETIQTEQGEKQVINSWAFASMLWLKAVEGNKNALGMVNELFIDKHELEMLLKRSRNGNYQMIRTAIAKVAFALDEKIQEAFESPNQ